MKVIVLLAAALLATSQKNSTEMLDLRLVEPFAIDLPADGEPADLLPADPSGTIRVSAAGGDITVCAVLALRSTAGVGTVTVRSDAATGPQGKRHDLLDVFLIKGLPRSNRYMRSALGQERMAVMSKAYPDILIANEPLFDKASGRAGGGTIPSIPAEDHVTASIGPGDTKYVLVRADIPRELTAGPHKTSVVVEAKNKDLRIRIPIEIDVLPFSLPGHGKVLSVANDFSSPGGTHFEIALRDQAEHGMTSTRVKDVLRGDTRDKIIDGLEELGFTHLTQIDPPGSADEAEPYIGKVKRYFYGVDEPQPKGRDILRPWSKMADHVRLSKKIHDLGGLVTTSLPYSFALELTQQESRVYGELKGYGVGGAFEPLDWANYTLGVQYLARGGAEREGQGRQPPETGSTRPATTRDGENRERKGAGLRRGRAPSSASDMTAWNQDFFSYIETLQKEYRNGSTRDGRTPLSKHEWIETYYFPLGFFKSPFLARLLFGYYLFNSHLDGVSAWTLYRPRGNPFSDADGEDPLIAYPTKEGMAPTYWWEAVREGVNDLRYCRLAEDLLIELSGISSQKGREMRSRLVSILSPYGSLMIEGRRIDRTLPLNTFRETRGEVIALIAEAREMVETLGPGKSGAGAGSVGK